MLAVLILLAVSSVALPAASVCSLEVEVVRVGQRAVPVRVELEEPNGRKQMAVFTDNGPVKFCNLGILPVKVVVGFPGCNQVIVNDVPVWWNKARQLRISYDDRSCNNELPSAAACKLLLRFVEPSGDSIRGVQVQIHGRNQRQLLADDFGRLFVAFADGTTLQGMAMSAGHQSGSLAYPCTREDRVMERFVTLVRE